MSDGSVTVRATPILVVTLLSFLGALGVGFYVHAAGTSPTRAAASLEAASGKRLFERNWTTELYSLSPLRVDNGLGPLFNEGSCAACQQPISSLDSETVAPGTVIRFGNAAGTGDSVYGAQLQTWGVSPNLAEAEPAI